MINKLYYGDNLTIMRNMPAACVDLIYLDPPFNSQRSYNLIYKEMTGLPVPEQEEAFCDAWELDPEKEEMARKMPIVLRGYGVDEGLVAFWQAWIAALRGTQPRLLAYLVYMTYRLSEMRRILKPTGTIYLHCDPTVSHYIKVIMDGVFGHQNFRNEISWKRSNPKGLTSINFPNCRDIIFRYTKSNSATFNKAHTAHDPAYVEKAYKYKDERGKRYRLLPLLNPSDDRPNLTYEFLGVTRVWRWTRERMEEAYHDGRVVQLKSGAVPQYKKYLDDSKGRIITNDWHDITPVHGKEALGYPTQKPIALLERIIEVSSDEGGVVFDPFCGCGTTIYAAHLTGRKWIGCDIAILSVRMVRDVLRKRYGLEEDRDYEVAGVPTSVDGARELFSHDPHQFQHWAVELAGGFCSRQRSGDRGIDGRIYFETSDGLRNMVLSVKGGKLAPAYVRELAGTISAPGGGSLGGFICLNEPTKGMVEAARSAGAWGYDGREYPRLQIRTVDDLLHKRAFDTPASVQTLDWERQGRLPF